MYDTTFVPRTDAHERAGVEIGQSIGPDAVGLIVGLSNTNSVAERFIAEYASTPFVNASFGGTDAIDWASGTRWPLVHVEIEEAGHSANDIEVVWMLHSLQGTAEPRIVLFCESLQLIIDQLVGEFPAVRQIFLSDRGYGGWSTGLAEDGTSLNGEPGVWAQAIGIDLVVAQNIARADGVWVGWGPYAWANGDEARADGFSWPRTFFRPDGVHWTSDGREAYAQMLHEFFLTDPVASWYRLD